MTYTLKDDDDDDDDDDFFKLSLLINFHLIINSPKIVRRPCIWSFFGLFHPLFV